MANEEEIVKLRVRRRELIAIRHSTHYMVEKAKYERVKRELHSVSAMLYSLTKNEVYLRF